MHASEMHLDPDLLGLTEKQDSKLIAEQMIFCCSNPQWVPFCLCNWRNW